jgi:hypothetical protein
MAPIAELRALVAPQGLELAEPANERAVPDDDHAHHHIGVRLGKRRDVVRVAVVERGLRSGLLGLPRRPRKTGPAGPDRISKTSAQSSLPPPMPSSASSIWNTL